MHPFEQDPSIETRTVEHHGELRVPVSIFSVVLNCPSKANNNQRRVSITNDSFRN